MSVWSLLQRKSPWAERVAIICERGTRRHMEDFYFVSENRSIYGGVYDGHNGRYVAERLSANLGGKFAEYINSKKSSEESFRRAYQSMGEYLNGQDSGACAADFFIRGDIISVANVGDARVVLLYKDERARQLTELHRLLNRREQERLEGMEGNGAIIRYPYVVIPGTDKGILPTRTIGDREFKPMGIISEPFVHSFKISRKENNFLIAATDGLWDFMPIGEVAHLAKGFDSAEKFANFLREEVLGNRKGNDNLTMIVMKLG